MTISWVSRNKKTLILLHCIPVQQHHIPSYQNPWTQRVLPITLSDYNEEENIRTLTERAWIYHSLFNETCQGCPSVSDEAMRRVWHKLTHIHQQRTVTWHWWCSSSRPISNVPKTQHIRCRKYYSYKTHRSGGKGGDRNRYLIFVIVLQRWAKEIWVFKEKTMLLQLETGVMQDGNNARMLEWLWTDGETLCTDERDNINKFERAKITYHIIDREDVLGTYQKFLHLLCVTVYELVVGWYMVSWALLHGTTIKGNLSRNLVL